MSHFLTPSLTAAKRAVADAAQFARTPRARKIAYSLAAAVTLFAILGFFVAPPILRSQLERVLTERLARQVTIERVRINPFAASASVMGLVVKERDGGTTVASFDELYLNLSYASVFRWAPIVEAVRLAKPYVRVVRNRDKTYNFQDLIERPKEPPPPSGPPPRFAVYNIEITDGRIDFDDQPERAQHTVSDLHVGIPFLSSLPAHVDIDVQPQLAAKVNGTPLAIMGETKPFQDTRATTLRLGLEDLSLPKYLDYVPVPLRFRVASGRLSTAIVLSFASVRDRPSRLTVSGTASVQDLSLQSLDGASVVGLGRFAVDVDSLDLLGRTAAVKRVEIAAPSVELVRAKNGPVNLMDVFALPPTEGQPDHADRPFAFNIGEIALVDGRVRVTDEVPGKGYRMDLQDIAISLQGLSNAPDAKADAKLRFETDAKGTLSYEGTLQLTPLRIGGQLAIAGFRLERLQPYVGDALNLELAGGSLDLKTALALGQVGEQFGGRLDDLAVTVNALALAVPGEKELLWQIPRMAIKDAAVDIGQQLVSIGELSIGEPKGYVRRDADGQTSYARLLKRAPHPTPAADSTQAAWRVQAKRLGIANGTVVFDDRVPPGSVQTQLTRLDLEIENYANANGAQAKTRLRTTVNGKGTVAVGGMFGHTPLAAALAVEMKGLELVPFQPYFEERVRAVVSGGAVSAKGMLKLDVPAQAPPRIAYRGDVSIADFATLDRATSQDLLRWQSLFVSGIDFELEPLKVAVEEIALSEFYSRLILDGEGRLNLQDVLQKGESAAAPESGADTSPAAAPTPALPPNVRIGKITLQGGNINYSDYFIKPNYSANLTGVGGGVTEMTPDTAGNVELRGRIDQTAPVEILGAVNAFSPDLFVDLKASAKDIELPPLSPYAIKYAGYGIERGKLSVNVKYHVDKRTLVAENNIYLDQLTFGEKVESPTATKLPVTLAVALLKDRNGVIDVNLPISGSLDDPQFSLGSVILRVIGNLIVKAVTAPFALLGAAFGGGEELAYLEFAPGSARVDTADEAKLKSLAKALTERPSLRLDVGGRAQPEVDRDGLKQAALERDVKAAKLKDLARSGSAAGVSLDDVTVEASEYAKYLERAYEAAKFPKPRNAIGLVKDLPVPEMENLMLANVAVTEDDLRQLANARAQAAKDWLVEIGKVPVERVFLVPSKIGTEGIKDKGKATRVDFALK